MNNYLLCVFSPVIVSALQYVLTRKPVCTIVGQQDPIEKRKYLISACFVLFLFVALRAPTVGSRDGQFYARNWEFARQIPLSQLSSLFKVDLEKGYLLTIWLLSHIFHNSQWLFTFQSAFMMLTVFCFLDENCESPFLGLMAFTSLGLFNFMIQAVRQSIAICICLLAITFVKKRKPVSFFLSVGLACAFHGSAIAFIPVFFLYGRKIRILDLTIVSVIAVLALRFLPLIFDLMNFAISDNYMVDQGSGFDTGFITILINGTILLICIISQMGAEKSEDYDFYLYMMIVFFIIFMLRYFVAGIAVRVSYYYMFSQSVLIPEALKRLEKKSQPLAGAAIVILMSILILHKASYSPLSPFPFFWQA